MRWIILLLVICFLVAGCITSGNDVGKVDMEEVTGTVVNLNGGFFAQGTRGVCVEMSVRHCALDMWIPITQDSLVTQPNGSVQIHVATGVDISYWQFKAICKAN